MVILPDVVGELVISTTTAMLLSRTASATLTCTPLPPLPEIVRLPVTQTSPVRVTIVPLPLIVMLHGTPFGPILTELEIVYVPPEHTTFPPAAATVSHDEMSASVIGIVVVGWSVLL